MAPTSTSVVDLINSIGDYSTLADSTRSTVSTTASYKDHKYELIAETRLNAHNAINGGNPVINDDDIDHDYSSLDDEPIPGSTLDEEEQEEEEEIVLTATRGHGLPHPYESSSTTTSPDSARARSAIERVNYDHLVLKKEGDTAGVSLTESDSHDYDSPNCAIYENTVKKDLEALYANDLLPATEALYDTLN